MKKTLYLASAFSLVLALVASAWAQPPGRPGPGRGPGRGRGVGPGDGIERIVDDLKLSEKKKEQSLAAVRAYRDNLGKLPDLARADLMLKMKETLNAEEFKKFKATLDR